jgi:hypothetical protein
MCKFIPGSRVCSVLANTLKKSGHFIRLSSLTDGQQTGTIDSTERNIEDRILTIYEQLGKLRQVRQANDSWISYRAN